MRSFACLTPDSEQRRQLKAVREHPAEGDHRPDAASPIDASINAVVRDHDVPEAGKISV